MGIIVLILFILFICFCLTMAYVTYKQDQKKKYERLTEEAHNKNQKEDRILELKSELKTVDAEMDPILHSVKSKNQARIEELEKKRNEICVELYELTGERTIYKGLFRSSWGPNPLEMKYTIIDTQRSKEKQKQAEKERLIQQQIRQKQQKKAESRVAYLAGWAIANAAIEKNKKEQKQKQQEKELKEMKELLKKMNKK